MLQRHFYDLSRGQNGRPACDSPDTAELCTYGEFATEPKPGEPQRCLKCIDLYADFLKRMRTCPICAQEFENGKAVAQHEGQHVLSKVSYHLDPLAFVVRLQYCYDESSTKARLLARAQAELKKFFAGKQFTVVPSRSMLSRDGGSSSLHGEAHVVDYIFIEI